MALAPNEKMPMVSHWHFLFLVVGWGQSNDGLKPAWLLASISFQLFSFPGLFPGFTIPTPVVMSGDVAVIAEAARHEAESLPPQEMFNA